MPVPAASQARGAPGPTRCQARSGFMAPGQATGEPGGASGVRGPPAGTRCRRRDGASPIEWRVRQPSHGHAHSAGACRVPGRRWAVVPAVSEVACPAAPRPGCGGSRAGGAPRRPRRDAGGVAEGSLGGWRVPGGRGGRRRPWPGRARQAGAHRRPGRGWVVVPVMAGGARPAVLRPGRGGPRAGGATQPPRQDAGGVAWGSGVDGVRPACGLARWGGLGGRRGVCGEGGGFAGGVQASRTRRRREGPARRGGRVVGWSGGVAWGAAGGAGCPGEPWCPSCAQQAAAADA